MMLRGLPLVQRRDRLAKLLRKAKPGIRLNEHIAADDATVFRHACKLDFEGIVSKRVDARYRSGRTRTWIKVRNKKAPAYTRMEDGTFSVCPCTRSALRAAARRSRCGSWG